jgi:hypothetical protein
MFMFHVEQVGTNRHTGLLFKVEKWSRRGQRCDLSSQFQSRLFHTERPDLAHLANRLNALSDWLPLNIVLAVDPKRSAWNQCGSRCQHVFRKQSLASGDDCSTTLFHVERARTLPALIMAAVVSSRTSALACESFPKVSRGVNSDGEFRSKGNPESGKLMDENNGSLYLSSRCADTLNSFSTQRADTAAMTAAPESVPATPSPSHAAPDPDRDRRSIG